MPDYAYTTSLPKQSLVGQEGRWEFTNRHGDTTLITGEFIGMGSSRRPRHNHYAGTPALPGQHCSTCRWTEIRIFRSVTDSSPGAYLVVNLGASVVPGEVDLIEFEWLVTAHEVMAKLTTSRGSDTWLTPPARRAAAQSAEFDGGMRDAYINSPVR